MEKRTWAGGSAWYTFGGSIWVAMREALVVSWGWWQVRQPAYQEPYFSGPVASEEWDWWAWQSLQSWPPLSRTSSLPSPRFWLPPIPA